MSNNQGTKKIAKNTILLYFRMILGMGVSLYTSRVVINVLGFDNFGIYNIICGIVVMFSFINTFLTNACQRYLSFSIAKDNISETKMVFSTSLFIHFLVLALFAVVAESAGLYFVYNKLAIPTERFYAAIWVFHIMVFESCISIFKVPYNAVIISEEKMDFYAYTSIIENVLRLIVVYFLVIIPFDKLISYSFFHIFVSLLMLLWYKTYSEKKFAYCTLSLKYNRQYFKQMISFSGWNLFGSIADIGYKQGTNIILNIFYGVALNAAMGIATTVRSSVYSFISNIQVAANPQIIKSYAVGDTTLFSSMINRVSKYSYFLMLLLAVPIIINIDFILKIWLGDVPDYSSSLIVLGLIFCLIDCLHGPLWTSMQATGKIRNYQLIVSVILLLNLPFSYIALNYGYSPNTILIVQIIVSFFTLAARLYFSRRYASLSIRKYVGDVIIPIGCVTLLSAPIPIYIATLLHEDWKKFFVTCVMSVITVGIFTLFVGMKRNERDKVIGIIIKRF